MIAGAVLGATLVLVIQRMFWRMAPTPTKIRR
jgi:hypothetical protein